MAIKILTDLHHRDLYYSNHLLLEKRLGFELYRPIEKDWADEGMWSQHTAVPYGIEPALIDQYLTPGCGENALGKDSFTRGDIINVHKEDHKYFQRAVPFGAFKDMEFDVIMPTHWCHYRLWEGLRNKYQPKAKMVYHVGNVSIAEDLGNVIRSVPLFPGSSKRDVLVHQELNTDIYRYKPIDTSSQNITSVTNGYMYSEDYERYKEAMPDVRFRYFGVNCPDGILHGTAAVYEKMVEANLGWTTKGWGGLGHSNMAWMYCGRPVITNMSQHRMYGECALKLFEPGVTCIDIEADTTEEVCKEIRKWMHPDNAHKYGEAAKKRFHEVVNYEEEAEAAKVFMDDVLND